MQKKNNCLPVILLKLLHLETVHGILYHDTQIINYSGCMQSYGEDCRYPCSKHCVNQTCNKFNGICHFGCESGYHGQKCEQGICMYVLPESYLLNIYWEYLLKVNTINFNTSNLNLFLEYPSTSCLSAVSAGFIGALVSACLIITTGYVIFIIRYCMISLWIK